MNCLLNEEKAQISIETMLLIVAAILAVSVVALFIKGTISSSTKAINNI